MKAFVGAFFAFTVLKSADAKCAKESGFVSTIVFVFSAWIAKAAEFVLIPSSSTAVKYALPQRLTKNS